MNVVDADKHNNSHLDIQYRIYWLDCVLQQMQTHPYYGCRYGLKFYLEYNFFRQIIPKKFFSEIDSHSTCPDIVSLVGVVVVRWALCV